ncbi:hypothetical protein, partial [Bradyrhizobium sp. NBAIM08]|uniref:hypothetical protein n=1 Tax=Bradyrhizobium sp. NBAIM08 TaxID=2793815 RepID=UPI001CD25A99
MSSSHRCAVSGQQFVISEQDLEFLERLSPKFGGQRSPLPPPQLCPDERRRRRMAFRNERNLYHRKCDATGKTVVSHFSPDKSVNVYSKAAWWSDDWDPHSFARPIDFSRPFFEQFAELFA